MKDSVVSCLCVCACARVRVRVRVCTQVQLERLETVDRELQMKELERLKR